MSTSKEDKKLISSIADGSLGAKKKKEKTEQPKAFDGPDHLLISHWNMGGLGTHCWKKGTLFALAESLNPSPDVILLSEIKSFDVDDDMYPEHDYTYEYLNPLPNPDHRGLYILYKKSLTRTRMGSFNKRSHDQSTEFVYVDFKLSNGIHRVFVVYHEHKKNAKIDETCPEHIHEFLKVFLTLDEPDFVHILGDFNLSKEDAITLNGLLDPNSQMLLDPSWETYGERQLDLIFSFSCDPKFSNNCSALAHHPFHPYDDLVKKIEKGNPLVKGKTEMFTEPSTKALHLTVLGQKTCEPALAPGDVHKVLLLHIGQEVCPKDILCCGNDSAEKCSKFYQTSENKTNVKKFLKTTHTGCNCITNQ